MSTSGDAVDTLREAGPGACAEEGNGVNPAGRTPGTVAAGAKHGALATGMAALADAPFDFDDLFRAQYGRVTSVISRDRPESGARRGAGRRRVPQAVADARRARTGRDRVGAPHGAAIGYRRVAPGNPAGPLRAASCGSSGTYRPRRTAPRPEKNAGACFASWPPFVVSTPRCCCSTATVAATTSWRRRSSSELHVRGHAAPPRPAGVSQGVHQTPWSHMTIPTSNAGWTRAWRP